MIVKFFEIQKVNLKDKTYFLLYGKNEGLILDTIKNSLKPKLPKNVGRGQVYITAKNVPPKTINIEGTSINGPIPPPEIIANNIIPIAPAIPITDAKSIFFSFNS